MVEGQHRGAFKYMYHHQSILEFKVCVMYVTQYKFWHLTCGMKLLYKILCDKLIISPLSVPTCVYAPNCRKFITIVSRASAHSWVSTHVARFKGSV